MIHLLWQISKLCKRRFSLCGQNGFLVGFISYLGMKSSRYDVIRIGVISCSAIFSDMFTGCKTHCRLMSMAMMVLYESTRQPKSRNIYCTVRLNDWIIVIRWFMHVIPTRNVRRLVYILNICGMFVSSEWISIGENNHQIFLFSVSVWTFSSFLQIMTEGLYCICQSVMAKRLVKFVNCTNEKIEALVSCILYLVYSPIITRDI